MSRETSIAASSIIGSSVRPLVVGFGSLGFVQRPAHGLQTNGPQHSLESEHYHVTDLKNNITVFGFQPFTLFNQFVTYERFATFLLFMHYL